MSLQRSSSPIPRFTELSEKPESIAMRFRSGVTFGIRRKSAT
jgi:hypothetical protein